VVFFHMFALLGSCPLLLNAAGGWGGVCAG
jgi:hypothetical protein